MLGVDGLYVLGVLEGLNVLGVLDGRNDDAEGLAAELALTAASAPSVQSTYAKNSARIARGIGIKNVEYS